MASSSSPRIVITYAVAAAVVGTSVFFLRERRKYSSSPDDVDEDIKVIRSAGSARLNAEDDAEMTATATSPQQEESNRNSCEESGNSSAAVITAKVAPVKRTQTASQDKKMKFTKAASATTTTLPLEHFSPSQKSPPRKKQQQQNGKKKEEDDNDGAKKPAAKSQLEYAQGVAADLNPSEQMQKESSRRPQRRRRSDDNDSSNESSEEEEEMKPGAFAASSDGVRRLPKGTLTSSQENKNGGDKIATAMVSSKLKRGEDDDEDDLVWENEHSKVEQRNQTSSTVVVAEDAEYSIDMGRKFEVDYIKSLVQNKEFSEAAQRYAFSSSPDDDHPDEKRIDPDGNTFLHVATVAGDLKLVRKLVVGKQLDPACRNNPGFSPLYIACALNHYSIAKFFLERRGVDPNQVRQSLRAGLNLKYLTFQKTDGGTPLHIAAELGYINICHLLLKHNADPSVVDRTGASPLFVACKNGNAELVHLLLDDYGSDPNLALKKEKITPLHICIRTGKLSLVRSLLDRDADVNAADRDGKTPLFYAIRYVDPNVVYAQAKANRQKSDFFEVSNQLNTLSLVEMLIDKGANVNHKDCEGNTPLIVMAARMGDANSEEKWISTANTSDTSDDSISFKVIETLVRNGTDINARNGKGMTALATAVLEDNVGGTKQLLEIGTTGIGQKISMSAYPEDGTLLHLAAARSGLPMVALLAKHEPHWVNETRPDGTTPLHLVCARRGFRHPGRTIDLLLDHGANINAQITDSESSLFGATPLYIATAFRNFRGMQVLIERGADVNLTAGDGSTCLSVAQEDHRTEEVELLEDAGAHGGGEFPAAIKDASKSRWNPAKVFREGAPIPP